jgi:molybdopterin molybdotransferase
MISVEEATSIILSHPFIPSIEKLEITKATGRILAQHIEADRDFPPFDRVSMDGIAIPFEAFQKGIRSFNIQDVQAAGKPQLKLTGEIDCIEVMTGAILPEGTDTVIRYEDLEIKNKVAVVITNEIIKGQNIHLRGLDARKKDKLLSPGHKISPAEVALFASIGKSHIEVYASPRVALISTGDELVGVDEVPLSHQIRRSNSYALQSALAELGLSSTQFHITDQKEILKKKLNEILASHELILLSGGVSKGKFDFVPEVIESLGVKKLFHGVSQKPGKPFWFGRSDKHTVFALPGNPVSTYLCFYRFIKPWIQKSFATDYSIPSAILAEDFLFKPALTYFLQVKVTNESGKLLAYPKQGGGSGDFANLKEVDGFLELPASQERFKATEAYPFIPFRSR